MGKENERKSESYWEFVMFDSDTGVTHSVVCHACRKPKLQEYDNFCANCGARMGGAEIGVREKDAPEDICLKCKERGHCKWHKQNKEAGKIELYCGSYKEDNE